MDFRDEDSFIEAMARVLGAGIPPMAGRIGLGRAADEVWERRLASLRS